MEKKSNLLLKITGIIMIIGGVVAIIVSLIGLLVGGLFAAGGSYLVLIGSLLALVNGIFCLIAGIKGAKHAANPQMAQSCIVWGILIVGLTILGTILIKVGGLPFNFVNLAVGLVLPALYIYGAYQLKGKA